MILPGEFSKATTADEYFCEYSSFCPKLIAVILLVRHLR
jgi:hypothetical protein